MFNRLIALYFVVALPLQIVAQASLATIGTAYTQDFNGLTGGTDGATYAWTNNTTLVGWYIDEVAGGADDLPILDATFATALNGGSAYLFRQAANTSLGSRAAGSTGTVHYGVRLKNNTGITITSLFVRYYGEQWSIAENNSNINTNAFSYQVAATVTSLTAGAWTNFTALDFTQIYNSTQSAGLGGTACAGTSAQCLGLNGTLAANRILREGCISVNIPAGNEIMLRWSDIDNAANDHHLQIDDFEAWPFDINCLTILPVELNSFMADVENNKVDLFWETASENNNAYFDLERLDENGNVIVVGRVNGNGTSSQIHRYHFTEYEVPSGNWYYRLKQVDFNGQYEFSSIVPVNIKSAPVFQISFNAESGNAHYAVNGIAGKSVIEIYSISGQLVNQVEVYNDQIGYLELPKDHGVYIVRLISSESVITRNLVK
jgi:hypothetical protein